MIYEVRYDPKTEKQIEKLPKEIAARIIKKMREVAETGRGIESIKEAKYGYKIRVGKYRVLIDLTTNPDTIWVRFIDLRDRVYKRIK